MATIKSHTDLTQSKVLAKILPLKSANMYYDIYEDPYFINMSVTHECIKNDKYQRLIPCWSLAALINVLPNNYIDVDDIIKHPSLIKTRDGCYMIIYSAFLYTSLCNNPIDACYKMILKLHELNLL